MANNTFIQLKRTATGGVEPTNLLANGELAVNLLDKRIFTTDTTGGAVFDAMQNTAANLSLTGSTVTLRIGNSTINSLANSSSYRTQNSTMSTIITIANVTTTNVFASFYQTGNIVSASQLGSGTANSTTYLAGDLSWKTVTGGSGSPGGANTQVQFNDSAAFGGDADFTFDKATNILAVGNSTTGSLAVGTGTSVGSITNTTLLIQANSTINSALTAVSLTLPVGNSSAGDVTTPSANQMAFFGKYKAARLLPAAIDGSGFGGYPLQPHFGHNPHFFMYPNPGATSTSVLRMVSANTIAFTARSPASTNNFLSQFRIAQATGTTAGTSTSWRNNATIFWRGNAAGLGGFYAVARFGVAISTTNGRAFVGFKDSTTILANGNPSAQTNVIGFGWDSTQTTLRAISANATVANTIDLGSGFPTNVGNTNFYEVVIFAPPNGGTVSYQVTNLKNGNVAFGSYNQTNLPSTTTFLCWQFWNNNGSDAVSQILDWGGILVETPL